MADLDPASLFNVNGLVAVVTGGGTGIGLMIAQALEANGATVYILGRRLEVLEKAASTAKHGNIHPLKADVTSKDDLASAAAHIAETTGYVNLLVPNSGIVGPALWSLKKDASLSEFIDYVNGWTMEEFKNTYATNTAAVFFTITAFLELLDKGNKKGNVRQTSQVIAVGSIAAFNRVALAGYAYGASKAGLTHMMKQLATRFVPYDIRVNVLAPGLFPSEMTGDALMQDDKAGTGAYRELIPADRPGNITDMGGAVLFLASRSGGFINGNVLIIDGGSLSITPASY